MKLKGYNQSQLARSIGMTQPEISNYWHGKNFPRLEVIRKLALEFVVSYEWLKTGNGNLESDTKSILESIHKTFPERLIWLIWTKGVNAKIVAEDLGFGGSTTITYWCESRRFPNVDNLGKLCEYFNVEMGWLRPGSSEVLIDYEESKRLRLSATEYFILESKDN